MNNAERRAEDLADPERHGVQVLPHQAVVHQIGEDLFLTCGEHVARNLVASLEQLPGERHSAARPSNREFELARRACQHDKPAFGTGYLDR